MPVLAGCAGLLLTFVSTRVSERPVAAQPSTAPVGDRSMNEDVILYDHSAALVRAMLPLPIFRLSRCPTRNDSSESPREATETPVHTNVCVCS